MTLLNVLVLAFVQGICELLPVSSSAHVIMAEKLMGLDPTSPEMTLLLVMLHTGTMFAVIVYFWRTWRSTYFASARALRTNGLHLVVATVLTGIVGLTLLQIIKHLYAANNPAFEIEHLFGNPQIMAAGLAVTGLLILYSAFGNTRKGDTGGPLTVRSAGVVGAVQGICLPFRGLSRSGATISTGLALGVARVRAEAFSFALAVVLTPAVIVKEGYRFLKMPLASGAGASVLHLLVPSLLGMAMSFVSGLLALRWLSSWLAHERWYLFGIYCLLASMVVFFVG
ncbi:undecaprenyl-diphosphate phosphatase [Rhodoferax sp.]|uniref:undecaprenyl-diphosphate phosphatase n=1 Tax=Rhodoferax sp. TaxID=50421 RepID=UPI0025D3A5C9|nr:undecaprenyl-diphosphate phosphatase [Rhodoferax sp.]